jgi:hypothetical protein
MQTIKVSTIGLLIYLLSSVNILATPSDAFSTQSDSLSNLTNPNPNLAIDALNHTIGFRGCRLG